MFICFEENNKQKTMNNEQQTKDKKIKSPPFTIILISAIFFTFNHASIANNDSLYYKVSMSSIISAGDHSPFWLVNNQYGQYPPSLSIFAVRPEIKKKYSPESTFGFAAGISTFSSYDERFSHRNYLEEAYLAGKFWFMIIQAGKKRMAYSNEFHPLSSGSLIMSQNARPVPMLSFRTDGYTNVPLTKGFIRFKAFYGDGILEEQRYTQRPYVHYKNLFGQIGGKLPVNFHYGFHHAVQWGGNNPWAGKIPVNFEAYKRAILGQEGSSKTTDIQGEKTNALGNHLGSKNMGLNFSNKKIETGIYWQTIFDDGSGKGNKNQPDGLYGAFYQSKKKKNWLSAACIEYLHTSNQSGPVHDIKQPVDSIIGGNDDYYNHYIYKSGWTFHGFTMGSPLLTSPLYNIFYSMRELYGESVPRYIPNTNVNAIHTGIEGWVNKHIKYVVKFTFAQNYGVKDFTRNFNSTDTEMISYLEDKYKTIEFNEYGEVYYELPGYKQYSGMFGLTFPLKLYKIPFTLETHFAFDQSKLYGNNFGFFVKLSNEGTLGHISGIFR